jgi:hypothetical protein
MRRYAALALVVLAGFTVLVSGASAALSTNSQAFGGTAGNGTTTNGRVYAIMKVGTVVYVGGNFSQVTDNFGTTVNRNNLAAFNLSGRVTAWNPNANLDVRALASNGKRVFVGGSFTTIHGQGAKGIAAISFAGTRIWGGGVTGGIVRTLRLDRTRIIFGGTFSGVQGKKRNRLASVSPVTGVVGSWNPDADHPVDAIVVGPNRIFIGGEFLTVGGKSQKHLFAISKATGKIVPFAHPNFPVAALALAGNLYVGGSGAGGWLSSFTPLGHRNWFVHIDGGVAAVAATSAQVIVGGHFNNWCKGSTATGSPIKCVTPVIRTKLLAANPTTGAVTAWAPTVNSVLGVFALRATQGRLYVGGDFTKINGTTRNHIARFTY